jgi:hypothetical protein
VEEKLFLAVHLLAAFQQKKDKALLTKQMRLLLENVWDS